ncbi:MAG TPA: helix-turn-helix domain-containing protein [Solirubrobacteraceae bacterium]|nr:helix-turn-helix domain-containing protein [Solirubrobacteraceae bacterium]
MSSTITMTGPLEPRSGWTADRCSMARTLDVVRNRASFLILREAFYGATRFEEFVSQTGLSEPVCAARLRELTDVGILRREPYQEPGQRTRHAYLLTEQGSELLPVLVALMQWGDRWAQDGLGAPVEFHHAGCGGRVGLELRCSGGHAVGGEELQLAVGPQRQQRS